MKPWQHGFELSTLDEYVELFSGFEAGIVVGPFTEANRRTVAEWLHRGEIRTLSDSYGRLEAAVVVRRYRNRPTVRDFTGLSIPLNRGARVLHRAVWRTPEGHDWIAELLPSFELCMLFPEHGAHRALIRKLGLVQLSAKFTAAAEIIGMYAPADSMLQGFRPEPIDDVGLARLRMPSFDVAPLAEATRTLTTVEHYSKANRGGSWSALALHGFGGRNDWIEKPSEMSRAWRRDNAARLADEISQTPLGLELARLVDPILRAIPGEKQRVRLMRLASTHGYARLDRHNDIADPESGTRDRQLMRLHVPIVTNYGVSFDSWDRFGQRDTQRMLRGECWYLDTRKPHAATNLGSEPRVHLVVDVHAGFEVRRLVPSPSRERETPR